MILILISLFAIFLRVIPILNLNFTFMFDHARDSLVIREMFVHHKPALIGPTTSIPGVFYGPAWYYIALPLNILGKFHPFASVITVLLIAGASVYLAGKYLGKFEALLYAVSAGLIGTQQSAWTPYMTSFLVLPTLIILKTIQKSNKNLSKKFVLLALCTSLLFHFQPAFAVVFTPLVIISLVLIKIPISRKQIIQIILAFCLPFLPSFIFELRHNFHQSKAVLDFIKHFQTQRFAIQTNKPNLILRMLEIGKLMVKSVGSAIPSLGILGIELVIIGFIIVYLTTKQAKNDRILLIPVLLETYILYLIFPCKPYYLVALLPIWVYSLAKAIRFFIPKSILLLSWMLIFLSLVNLSNQVNEYKKHSQTESFLLAPKIKAVQLAYQLSDNKPFVSYHFVPDIYDYTYQHIYLYLSLFYKKLPYEFSYAPGESSYIPQKHILPSKKKPEFVILIVEPYKPYTAKEVFYAWWDRVAKNVDILEKKNVNQAIVIYKGVYKNNSY